MKESGGRAGKESGGRAGKESGGRAHIDSHDHTAHTRHSCPPPDVPRRRSARNLDAISQSGERARGGGCGEEGWRTCYCDRDGPFLTVTVTVTGGLERRAWGGGHGEEDMGRRAWAGGHGDLRGVVKGGTQRGEGGDLDHREGQVMLEPERLERHCRPASRRRHGGERRHMVGRQGGRM